MLINHQLHPQSILYILISQKAFTCQISFYVYKRSFNQFLKSFFIRFKAYASMNKKGEVGPYIMDGIQVIAFNHHLHTHLNPSRNAHHKTNIPMRGFFNNLFQFLLPVLFFGNLLSRLIKGLKPERCFLSSNAT